MKVTVMNSQGEEPEVPVFDLSISIAATSKHECRHGV